MSALAETEWLCRQISKLTTHIDLPSPSEWAESKRYLPQSATTLPGFYRFSAAPYMREIADCMDPESPVRHVSVMRVSRHRDHRFRRIVITRFAPS